MMFYETPAWLWIIFFMLIKQKIIAFFALWITFRQSETNLVHDCG